MTAEIKGDSLVITIPFNKTGVASKSGKSTVHATTNGNKELTVKGMEKPLVFGINVYSAK